MDHKNNEMNPSCSSNRGRGNPLSRAEKSLTALTTKFMTLLQESPNGILDLRSVSKIKKISKISFCCCCLVS
jgi:hypothetical protein